MKTKEEYLKQLEAQFAEFKDTEIKCVSVDDLHAYYVHSPVNVDPGTKRIFYKSIDDDIHFEITQVKNVDDKGICKYSLPEINFLDKNSTQYAHYEEMVEMLRQKDTKWTPA